MQVTVIIVKMINYKTKPLGYEVFDSLADAYKFAAAMGSPLMDNGSVFDRLILVK
jgi:hypothetical protein